MQNLQVIELKGQRVLTTRQLATAYETEVKVIQNNFQRNKERYTVGKHYIYMDRDELREVKATYPQFEGELSRTSRANFWTEKGALLHAKSLNTDKAWEVYDYLVDFYFRAQEKPEPVKKEVVPVTVKTEPIKDEIFVKSGNADEIAIFKTLLSIAEKREIKVKTLDLRAAKSYLHKNRIGIRQGMTLTEVNYELAFELFHSIVNYDRGNMIDTPLRKYYNAQAERAASFIIQLLETKTAY
jgi:phage anti-repressor protein